MKILKDKTYNSLKNKIEELENKIEELEKENRKLDKLNEQQSDILEEVKKEYADFVTNTKLNFSIKRIVVGNKASGKTTFVKSILHKIPNYFVIDLNAEYNEVVEDRKFVPKVGIKPKELDKKVRQVVLDNKDKTLIIEQGLDYSFLQWFLLNSRGFNFILISQSKKRLEPFINDIDFIYDFGTNDSFRGVIKDNKIMHFAKKTSSKTVAIGMLTLSALGLVAAAGNAGTLKSLIAIIKGKSA